MGGETAEIRREEESGKWVRKQLARKWERIVLGKKIRAPNCPKLTQPPLLQKEDNWHRREGLVSIPALLTGSEQTKDSGLLQQ